MVATVIAIFNQKDCYGCNVYCRMALLSLCNVYYIMSTKPSFCIKPIEIKTVILVMQCHSYHDNSDFNLWQTNRNKDGTGSYAMPPISWQVIASFCYWSIEIKTVLALMQCPPYHDNNDFILLQTIRNGDRTSCNAMPSISWQ